MGLKAVRTVSVITVTYNCASLVGKALSSVTAQSRSRSLRLELLVVDNASTDASVARVQSQFPDATVIANSENVGFGRANNQAFSVASGDYWLLLNPDATMTCESLARLVDFLDRSPGIGAVAPSVSSPRGSGIESAGMAPGLRSAAGHFLLLNRLLWRDRGGAWRGLHVRRRPKLGARRVDWVSAAVVLLRPQAVRQLNGFDPRFFMYGEDVDLCERLCAAGWEVWIEPAAHAEHLVAGSQGRVRATWVDAVHAIYAARASRTRLFVFDSIMALGLVFRSLFSGLRQDDASRAHSEAMLCSAQKAWLLAKQSS